MSMNKTVALFISGIMAFAFFGCANKTDPVPAAPSVSSIPSAASAVKMTKLHSALLKKDMNVNLYLPAGYGGGERYPVLYILHGYSGNENAWIPELGLNKKADELIADKKIKPLIIVSPQIENSYGLNSSEEPRVIGTPPNRSLNYGMYEDYICKELVSYIDTNYSTVASRDGRYIGGLSMGGCAALHLAFSHTDMFSRAGGHSPALFLDKSENSVVSWLYPDDKTRRSRDPLLLADDKDLKELKVYLDCGDKDSYKFYQGCEKLYEILQEKGVGSEYHLNPGEHSGAYWEGNTEKYLLFYAGID